MPPEPPIRRPKSRGVGSIRLRAIRGPNAAGEWYWRGEECKEGRRDTVLAGWFPSVAAVERAASAVLLEGRSPKRAAGNAASTAARCTTLGDVLDYYLGDVETRADLSPATVKLRTGSCQRLVATVGAHAIPQVGRATLQNYRDQRLRTGLAPRTVAQDLEELRRAWRWAIERGLVASAPLPSLPLKTPPVTSRYTPSREEVGRVLEALRAAGGRGRIMPGWPRLALLLQFATGARVGEIAALKVGDVNLGRGTLRLDGKTGARTVPVAAHVLEEIRPLLEGRGPEERLLPVAQATVEPRLSVAIGEACAELRIPHWTTHAVRRLAVDQLARAGVDVATAASLLGHSPLVMLRAYRQVSDEDRAKAVAAARLGESAPLK